MQVDFFRIRVGALFTALLMGLATSLAEDPGTGAPGPFKTYCVPCHGPDGRAQTPVARRLGVKDLTQSRATDAEILRQITEGKKNDKGREVMPSFKQKLTPDQIQSLVTFVKGLRK